MTSTVIVGLGGFGGKRVADLYEHRKNMGNVEFLVIDGSDSDIRDRDFPKENIWLVPGTDGAGKIRGAQAPVYEEFINQNYSRLPEADLYILVYTVSGGTGSVMGPRLARNLTENDQNVINAVMCTSGSHVDSKNTMNTMRGLGNHVKKLQKPIFLSFFDQEDHTLEQADLAVCDMVMELNQISSFENSGLDTSDIHSFFNYPIHGLPPQLTLVERFTDPEKLTEEYGRILTTLSLSEDKHLPIPEVGAVFNTKGVTNFGLEGELHFVTSTVNMGMLAKRLQERFDEHEKTRKSLASSSVFESDADDMEY